VKPSSRDARPTSKDQPKSTATASMWSTEQLPSPIKKLEETLSTYMLALQARKGNIVGRSLKMRASADELAVIQGICRIYMCVYIYVVPTRPQSQSREGVPCPSQTTPREIPRPRVRGSGFALTVFPSRNKGPTGLC
jgi:hypothetical protein